MKPAHRGLANRRRGSGYLAHPKHGLVVINCFEMILQRLAAHRDAVLDDLRRLAGGERVPLDCVRGIGQLDVIVFLQLHQSGASQRTQCVQPLLECGDAGGEFRGRSSSCDPTITLAAPAHAPHRRSPADSRFSSAAL